MAIATEKHADIDTLCVNTIRAYQFAPRRHVRPRLCVMLAVGQALLNPPQRSAAVSATDRR